MEKEQYLFKYIWIISGLALILAATVSYGGTAPAPTLPTVTAAPSGSPQEAVGFTPQDPLSMPEETGPPGLNSINLPQDNDSIMALFDQLPSTLLGRHRAGEDSTAGGFGRDGKLFWLNMQTFCSTGSSLKDSLDITTWGVAGSPWVFSATAQGTESRDELVAALVAASE
jgi:hypothetical protein